MKQRVTIQKAKAIFLLLVFAFSITPKLLFHDLLANHKDAPACNQVHKTAVLHHEGYNCHFDDLVVSVPFLLASDQPVVLTKFYLTKKQASFCSSSTQSFLQHKENRGPPSA